MTQVLIDARNVLRSRWPNVPEPELVECCRAWAAARGHHAVVIFDGRAPGRVVGAKSVDDACTLVGSGGESADDWIARHARELALRAEPYWLISSDRELRERAGSGAERQIGGGAFLVELGLRS